MRRLNDATDQQFQVPKGTKHLASAAWVLAERYLCDDPGTAVSRTFFASDALYGKPAYLTAQIAQERE
jgi:hypothetical protein